MCAHLGSSDGFKGVIELVLNIIQLKKVPEPVQIANPPSFGSPLNWIPKPPRIH